jgi:hypothetical protein
MKKQASVSSTADIYVHNGYIGTDTSYLRNSVLVPDPYVFWASRFWIRYYFVGILPSASKKKEKL